MLMALGSAYFRNGEPEAAETNWKAAVEVNPKYGRFDQATGTVVAVHSTATGTPSPTGATGPLPTGASGPPAASP